jgi:hypothetical protein
MKDRIESDDAIVMLLETETFPPTLANDLVLRDDARRKKSTIDSS